MRGVVPLLAIAGASAVGLVLAFTGSAHAATTGGSSGGPDDEEPTDVAQRVADALASHDAGKMRGEADALEREGYTAAAAALRDEANRIDPQQTAKPKPPTHPQAIMSQQGQQAAAAMTGHTAGGTAPSSQSAGLYQQPAAPAATWLPAAPAPANSTATGIEDPNRALAQQVTTMLQSIGGLKGRGSEDKGLVGRFQSQEKLTVDSKYGPGTATRILQRYGIIPVAPFYWSKKNASNQKKMFTSFVRSYMTGDPERSAQYQQLLNDTNRS